MTTVIYAIVIGLQLCVLGLFLYIIRGRITFKYDKNAEAHFHMVVISFVTYANLILSHYTKEEKRAWVISKLLVLAISFHVALNEKTIAEIVDTVPIILEDIRK